MNVQPKIDIEQSKADNRLPTKDSTGRVLPYEVQASVEILRLRKTDRIVLHLNKELSVEQRQHLKDILAIRFKGHDVIVLDAGVKLTVFRTGGVK